MTFSFLRFTPLYGANSSEAFCFLLKVGTVTILLDCGWKEPYDLAVLEPVVKILPQVDIVLLSHPDPPHLGALPYLVSKAGLKAPIYAAAPVAKLGPMFMYDQYTALHAVSEFDLFNTEDIDIAFESIRTLKHHQNISMDVKGQQIKLVGYPAGHMTGGTVWVLECKGEVVVYGLQTNHNKERLLSAGQLDQVPSRPALLITDAARARAKEVKRSARDKDFQQAVLGVLRNAGKGNVLLPVDTAGRMLEVLLVLDRIWQPKASAARLPYPIVLLSCVATSTLTAARGLLEYMSAELQNEFHTTYNNPLNIRGLQFAHSVADVSRLPAGPKVVLATGWSLDCGLARQLLLQWGQNPHNAVIFTQPPQPGTFAAELLASGPRSGQPGGRTFTLTVGQRVQLEGEELEAYEAARMLAEADAPAAGRDDDDDDDDDAAVPLRECSAVNVQLKRSHTGGLDRMNETQDMFEDTNMVEEDVLMDGFVPPKTAMYCMFPDEQELVSTKWDDWGAVMDISNLRTAEDADAVAAAGDEDEYEADERPTKVVTEQVTFTVQATVSYIDGFSGCSDGRSLRNILGALAPRALVLVGGSEQDTAVMSAACTQELPPQQTRVYTPGVGEELSFPLANSYPIAVSSQLLHSLSTHSLASGKVTYDVAWIDGQLGRLQTPVAPEVQQGVGSSKQQQEDTLSADSAQEQLDFVLQAHGTVAAALPAAADSDVAPGTVAEVVAASDEAMDVDEQAAGQGPARAVTDHESSAGDHGGIFIGSVQLSEVKSALAKAGFVSEFRAGKLVVGGSLVVKREGAEGQLMLEGPLCDDYFKVRDVVYSQYNVC